MILILSETYDTVTDSVCSYLLRYNVPFLRLNDKDPATEIDTVTLTEKGTVISFLHQGKRYTLGQFCALWCRRGMFRIRMPEIKLPVPASVQNTVLQHLEQEYRTLTSFIYEHFKTKPCINNPLLYSVNKLHVLETAVRCGLDIPATYVCRSPELLLASGNKPFITKNFSDIIVQKEHRAGTISGSGTNRVQTGKLPQRFNYSLFQEEIPKKYELRIFFFAGTFFAVAMFSHHNTGDTRDEDPLHPTRIEPFSLPGPLKRRLLKLMHILRLESGSIDMIACTDGRYVFLEVNPVGQFEWVSSSANYHIEQHIALYFKKIYETDKHHSPLL